jgi:hypothetical protein
VTGLVLFGLSTWILATSDNYPINDITSGALDDALLKTSAGICLAVGFVVLLDGFLGSSFPWQERKTMVNLVRTILV